MVLLLRNTCLFMAQWKWTQFSIMDYLTQVSHWPHCVSCTVNCTVSLTLSSGADATVAVVLAAGAEAAYVVQIHGQILVALILWVLLSVHWWQAGTGHAQDDCSQGFDVVLGQCQSLDLGNFFVCSDMWNGLSQGLKSVVQFVHPLSLSLVALQPAHVTLLGAAVLASAATTRTRSRSGTALNA